MLLPWLLKLISVHYGLSRHFSQFAAHAALLLRIASLEEYDVRDNTCGLSFCRTLIIQREPQKNLLRRFRLELWRFLGDFYDFYTSGKTNQYSARLKYIGLPEVYHSYGFIFFTQTAHLPSLYLQGRVKKVLYLASIFDSHHSPLSHQLFKMQQDI